MVLILDVMGLAQKILMASDKTSRDQIIESSSSNIEDEETQTMLIVSLGNDRKMAIPLTNVARLEELKRSDIEISGREQVVQYRNEIMPLINIPQRFNIPSEDNGERLQTVVHTYEGKSLGLVVERILDIVQGKIDTKRAIQGSDLMGTIVTNDFVVDVIDVKVIVQSFLKTS